MNNDDYITITEDWSWFLDNINKHEHFSIVDISPRDVVAGEPILEC